MKNTATRLSRYSNLIVSGKTIEEVDSLAKKDLKKGLIDNIDHDWLMIDLAKRGLDKVDKSLSTH